MPTLKKAADFIPWALAEEAGGEVADCEFSVDESAPFDSDLSCASRELSPPKGQTDIVGL